MHFAAGSILEDKYEILASLGAGGMGAVYKARQISLDRIVALKFLLLNENGADPEALARLEREAKALSQLHHKNIVAVYGSHTSARLPFIVMEYLTGQTLQQALYENLPLDISLIQQVTEAVCDAMHCAHAHGIIHRDLKPSNVMLVDNGDIKLLDFGLAKLVSSSGLEVQKLTEAGTAIGSVCYMSPEQCLGEESDERADVYALGCLLYHCVTGAPPFTGDHTLVVMQQHLNDRPPRFTDASTGLSNSVAIQSVLDRAMAKAARDRFASAAELKQEMLAALAGPYCDEPTTPAPSVMAAMKAPGKKIELRDILPALAIAAFCCFVLFGVFVATETSKMQIADLHVAEESVLQAAERFQNADDSSNNGAGKASAQRELLLELKRLCELNPSCIWAQPRQNAKMERCFKLAFNGGSYSDVAMDVTESVLKSKAPGTLKNELLVGLTKCALRTIDVDLSYGKEKTDQLYEKLFDLYLSYEGPVERALAGLEDDVAMRWSQHWNTYNSPQKVISILHQWTALMHKQFPNSMAEATAWFYSVTYNLEHSPSQAPSDAAHLLATLQQLPTNLHKRERLNLRDILSGSRKLVQKKVIDSDALVAVAKKHRYYNEAFCLETFAHHDDWEPRIIAAVTSHTNEKDDAAALAGLLVLAGNYRHANRISDSEAALKELSNRLPGADVPDKLKSLYSFSMRMERARILLRTKEYTKALDSALSVVKDCPESTDALVRARATTIACMANERLGNLDVALKLGNEAERMFMQANESPVEQLAIKTEIAVIKEKLHAKAGSR